MALRVPSVAKRACLFDCRWNYCSDLNNIPATCSIGQGVTLHDSDMGEGLHTHSPVGDVLDQPKRRQHSCSDAWQALAREDQGLDGQEF